MSELIALRHATTRALFDEVDHIIVLANWIRAVLLGNGVSEQKITLCRHGLAHENRTSGIKRVRQSNEPLRLVFFGRLDETKGIDTVVKALYALPNASITLDIYAILQDKTETEYQKKLKNLIAQDKRIRIFPPVSGNQVISLLQNYDLLVVPSRVLETGPLVVLEAFAAGVPVIGSKLGGIAEWIEDGINGFLIEANSPKAWSEVLQQLLIHSARLRQITSNIQPIRTMTDVTTEMLAVYQAVKTLS